MTITSVCDVPVSDFVDDNPFDNVSDATLTMLSPDVSLITVRLLFSVQLLSVVALLSKVSSVDNALALD